MKKKILALAAIAICLSIIGYSTLAFYTSSQKDENVITSGNVKIELEEWADSEKKIPYEDQYPNNEVTGILPGVSTTKIVEVKNTGDNPVWIRVDVKKDIQLKDGTNADVGLMTMDYDLTHWTLWTDGYYYYNERLDAGQTTEPLFASVSFDEGMTNEYQNCTAKVEVTAYAVQVANNGTTFRDALGWPSAK